MFSTTAYANKLELLLAQKIEEVNMIKRLKG
jgi:hypothetical protein